MAGGGGPLVSVVEEYDPVTDTWTQKSAKMPTPRSMFSISVVNGKIYAIGGEDRNINVNNIVNPCGVSTVEEYDPIKDVWTKKVDMPTKRCCLSTSAVNGKIYAIGGTDTLLLGEGFATVEEYTP
jgi:N-acetylneuraminic acid mutarotase